MNYFFGMYAAISQLSGSAIRLDPPFGGLLVAFWLLDKQRHVSDGLSAEMANLFTVSEQEATIWWD